MITLIIDDHIPFIKGILEPYARVIYATGGKIDRAMAKKADGIIIRTRTICNADLLEGTPVRFIATATIGYDHIDLNYCKENDIRWYHAPGCNSSSVRQYIASVLVTFEQKHEFTLQGKNIGIIGVGHVGSKVAQLAQTLGMNVLQNDPPREDAGDGGPYVPLREILERCDIITFHVPLTHDGPYKTHHLANGDFFDHLLQKPLFINTSRGGTVETGAVKTAIKKGLVSGFVADVWENEPAIDLELLPLADIATPHIAGYSVEGKANGTAACVRAASRFFGFGIDQWYPDSLPAPESPVIDIATHGNSEDELIRETINSTYNVMNDDVILRNNPSQFENLRNFYPVRREFEAYKIKSNGMSMELINKLKQLGFTI